MGLDISLLKISKNTNANETFLVSEFPELNTLFKDFIKEETLFFKELSYQRKGVKLSFYEKYGADDFIKTEKEAKELEKFILKENKDSYQKNFLSSFEEGKTIISISY